LFLNSLSAAVTYNEAYKPKLAKRLAYAHDHNDAQDNFDMDDPKDYYGIDVSVHELQAYAHNRMSRPKPNRSGREHDQRTRMPFDRWSKLSIEERALWDQLGETAKAMILGSSAPKTAQTPASTKRHMNLHEISAYEYLQANIHETAQESTDDDLDQYHEANETEGQDINQDSTLLVNSTTSQKTLTPGDIRRVMSSAKRYQGSGDSKKTTRDVKMHVTYVVSAHRSTAQHSLVDRGSNGGVAGHLEVAS
jgi:hypothetical protein